MKGCLIPFLIAVVTASAATSGEKSGSSLVGTVRRVETEANSRSKLSDAIRIDTENRRQVRPRHKAATSTQALGTANQFVLGEPSMFCEGIIEESLVVSANTLGTNRVGNGCSLRAGKTLTLSGKNAEEWPDVENSQQQFMTTAASTPTAASLKFENGSVGKGGALVVEGLLGDFTSKTSTIPLFIIVKRNRFEKDAVLQVRGSLPRFSSFTISDNVMHVTQPHLLFNTFGSSSGGLDGQQQQQQHLVIAILIGSSLKAMREDASAAAPLLTIGRYAALNVYRNTAISEGSLTSTSTYTSTKMPSAFTLACFDAIYVEDSQTPLQQREQWLFAHGSGGSVGGAFRILENNFTAVIRPPPTTTLVGRLQVASSSAFGAAAEKGSLFVCSGCASSIEMGSTTATLGGNSEFSINSNTIAVTGGVCINTPKIVATPSSSSSSSSSTSSSRPSSSVVVSVSMNSLRASVYDHNTWVEGDDEVGTTGVAVRINALTGNNATIVVLDDNTVVSRPALSSSLSPSHCIWEFAGDLLIGGESSLLEMQYNVLIAYGGGSPQILFVGSVSFADHSVILVNSNTMYRDDGKSGIGNGIGGGGGMGDADCHHIDGGGSGCGSGCVTGCPLLPFFYFGGSISLLSGAALSISMNDCKDFFYSNCLDDCTDTIQKALLVVLSLGQKIFPCSTCSVNLCMNSYYDEMLFVEAALGAAVSAPIFEAIRIFSQCTEAGYTTPGPTLAPVFDNKAVGVGVGGGYSLVDAKSLSISLLVAALASLI